MYDRRSILTRLRLAAKDSNVKLSKRGDIYTASGIDRISFVDEIVKRTFGSKMIVADAYCEFDHNADKVRFRIESNTELVESVNIMTGKKIMIPAYLKGGCCDPATETYWSM